MPFSTTANSLNLSKHLLYIRHWLGLCRYKHEWATVPQRFLTAGSHTCSPSFPFLSYKSWPKCPRGISFNKYFLSASCVPGTRILTVSQKESPLATWNQDDQPAQHLPGFKTVGCPGTPLLPDKPRCLVPLHFAFHMGQTVSYRLPITG